MRLEWYRARARAHRWTEECQLLIEEMRRILAFYQWHESWWREQAERITMVTEAEREGLIAYAYRQASIRQNMRTICISAWKDASVIFRGSGILSSFSFSDIQASPE